MFCVDEYSVSGQSAIWIPRITAIPCANETAAERFGQSDICAVGLCLVANARAVIGRLSLGAVFQPVGAVFAQLVFGSFQILLADIAA